MLFKIILKRFLKRSLSTVREASNRNFISNKILSMILILSNLLLLIAFTLRGESAVSVFGGRKKSKKNTKCFVITAMNNKIIFYPQDCLNFRFCLTMCCKLEKDSLAWLTLLFNETRFSMNALWIKKHVWWKNEMQWMSHNLHASNFSSKCRRSGGGNWTT